MATFNTPQKIFKRCLFACEAEAVAQGFSRFAGYEIFAILKHNFHAENIHKIDVELSDNAFANFLNDFITRHCDRDSQITDVFCLYEAIKGIVTNYVRASINLYDPEEVKKSDSCVP